MGQDPRLSKVLLFTDQNGSTVLYKALSLAYLGRLLFATVQPGNSQLEEQYGVTQHPKLLVVTPDGTQHQYTGPLQAGQLKEFLDNYASKQLLTPVSNSSKGSDGPSEVVIHNLTASDLLDVDRDEDIWLVAFYAAADDNACASQLWELSKLCDDVQAIVNYGQLNAAKAGLSDKTLRKLGVHASALRADGCELQLVLLTHGRYKASTAGYVRWPGGLDNTKALQAWILEQVPDLTIELTDEEDAQAYINATAADMPIVFRSQHHKDSPIGKVFLFSTKQDVPGLYKALAMRFHGKARLVFAWTSPDESGPGYPLMQRMHVQKAPAMSILLPLPPRPLADASDIPGPKDDMAMQQYMGPLKFNKMLAWVQTMANLIGINHAGSTAGPSPEHFEVHNQQQLQQACYDKPSLCMILLLGGRSCDANKHKYTLKKAAQALTGHPLSWVAVDVARQPSFRRAYGFRASQLPGLVAVSTRRLQFAQGAAPFNETNARGLVTAVLMESARTLPLPALPWLVNGGEPEEATFADTAKDDQMAAELQALLGGEQSHHKAGDRKQQPEGSFKASKWEASIKQTKQHRAKYQSKPKAVSNPQPSRRTRRRRSINVRDEL
eukprot:GHRR01015576.1.p1 GENE.GHRR01015576.1~~GHRR01015576.1.p1  ORF type:complete len:609 (+),score=148.82 GHRR01015576.1:560-2386(+)